MHPMANGRSPRPIAHAHPAPSVHPAQPLVGRVGRQRGVAQAPQPGARRSRRSSGPGSPTELAGPLLAWNVLATAAAPPREGHGIGVEGAAAVAARTSPPSVSPASCWRACGPTRSSSPPCRPTSQRRSSQARPRSVRAGAWLPILYGGRGRRMRTRNVIFTPPDSPYELALDVYQPIEATPGQRRPAIIQIHGGAWIIGDKREQGIPLLNHLANLGWVGFNVNYRKSPTGEGTGAPHRLQGGDRLGPRQRRSLRRRPRLHRRHRRVGGRSPLRARRADRQRSRVPTWLRGDRHHRPGRRPVLRRVRPGRRRRPHGDRLQGAVHRADGDGLQAQRRRFTVRAVLADAPGAAPTRRRC